MDGWDEDVFVGGRDEDGRVGGRSERWVGRWAG